MSASRIRCHRNVSVAFVTTAASAQSGATLSLFTTARSLDSDFVRAMIVMPPVGSGAERLVTGGSLVMIYTCEALTYPHLGRGMTDLAMYLSSVARSIRYLSRLVKCEHITLIHANEVLDLPAIITGWLLGVPVVMHLRASIQIAWVRWLLAGMARLLPSAVIAVSDACARAFFGSKLPSNVRVVYDPGPSNDARYSAPDLERLERLRQELGVTPDDRVILSVAKLHPLKGHDTAIRALAQVFPAQPNAKLVIVGGALPRHQTEKARLEALARGLSVSERVIFAGYRSDVLDCMDLAHVVVFMSKHSDPFPGVVLEAMARGRPIVATRVGGVPEQAANGKDALLVNPDDPVDAAKAIQALLADADLGSRLGSQARESLSRFTLARHIAEITEVYDSVLMASRGRQRYERAR